MTSVKHLKRKNTKHLYVQHTDRKTNMVYSNKRPPLNTELYTFDIGHALAECGGVILV